PRLTSDEPVEVTPLVAPPHLLEDLASHLLDGSVRCAGDAPVAHELPVVAGLADEPIAGRVHDSGTELTRELVVSQLAGVLADDRTDLLACGLLVRLLQIRAGSHPCPVQERVRNPHVAIPLARSATSRTTWHGAVAPVDVVEVHRPGDTRVH